MSKKHILLIIITLILLAQGLIWLTIIFISFTLIYCFSFRYISLIHSAILKKIVKSVFLIFFLLLSTISVKLLAFDIYKIPSSSMENLLYPEDVIVVNKLKYGPKLPRSPFEIPWVNLAFYMNKDARSRIKEIWWDYSRWGGTTTIKQGDVFVFSLNTSLTFFVVKRCVGLPGDTINIKKGEVYINSKLYNSPGTVKNNCSFRIKDKKLLYKILDSLSIEGYVNYDYRKPHWGSAMFSKKEFEFLKKENCIDSVRKKIDAYNTEEKLLKIPASQWTLDDMGPIIIPKKDMQILLNPSNYMLYEKVINMFEKCKLTEKEGTFFIDGKRANNYKFKLNYYFMMGDNRKGTHDSRRWGFLPETNVIGKVECILFSNKNDEFQWDRLFKKL